MTSVLLHAVGYGQDSYTCGSTHTMPWYYKTMIAFAIAVLVGLNMEVCTGLTLSN